MIVILKYQPTWPGEFLQMGRILRAELGDLALRIDHIGSTSIPNLDAKDIIDIQVTVANFVPEVAEAICRAGFKRVEYITGDHIPSGWIPDPAEWSKWIFSSLPETRRMNLHVRQAGRANQRYPLLFRDYLRATPSAAETYGKIKIALVESNATDVDAYYAVKDPVCDLIIDAAEIWASVKPWHIGPSDC